ncbi:type II toxin-antitoxin system death-on-curing family toxin [Streptomyces luteireticuli]|uniref:type II toxin-antitoxin system death-on-curing family toxin n=1 Tax=Streptomyces luteireticuli TaxID=173858 RepID=UPI0035589E1A
MTLHYLSTADVLIVAEPACGETELVLRDVNSLESAVHRPLAEMYGQQVHPDLIDKAAALLQAIAINHPLFDGNKRTAWLSCATFLALNGIDLRSDIDAAERLVIAVTTGEIRDVRDIAQELRDLVEDPPLDTDLPAGPC